jgi:hypothetical protein
MAQGKWYVLQDKGAGKLIGTDVSFGSGTLSFTTGAVVVTLGALPDVGTAIIFTYGLAGTDIVRAGIALKARRKITLPHQGIAPNTVTLTWPNGSGGSYTAADNGSGLITGDATGKIEYSTGTLWVEPNVLPPQGAEMDVDYSVGNGIEVTFADPARQPNGTLALTLPDTDILPNTLTLSWGVDVDTAAIDKHYSYIEPKETTTFGFWGITIVP